MGDFTKIIRWLAPGSTALLFAIATVFAFRVALHIISGYAIAPLTISSNVSLVLAAAAMPTGLILYQFYYFAFVHSSRLGLWAPGDDAIRVYSRLKRSGITVEGFDLSEQPFHVVSRDKDSAIVASGWRALVLTVLQPLGSNSFAWLKERGKDGGYAHPVPRRGALKNTRVREYALNRDENRAQLEAGLYRTRTAGVIHESAFNELDRLGDIYHSLGAVRLAIPLGFTLGFAYVVATDAISGNIDWKYLVLMLTAGVLLGSLTIFTTAIVHKNRTHSRWQRIRLMTSILEAGAKGVPSAPPTLCCAIQAQSLIN